MKGFYFLAVNKITAPLYQQVALGSIQLHDQLIETEYADIEVDINETNAKTTAGLTFGLYSAVVLQTVRQFSAISRLKTAEAALRATRYSLVMMQMLTPQLAASITTAQTGFGNQVVSEVNKLNTALEQATSVAARNNQALTITNSLTADIYLENELSKLNDYKASLKTAFTQLPDEAPMRFAIDGKQLTWAELVDGAFMTEDELRTLLKINTNNGFLGLNKASQTIIAQYVGSADDLMGLEDFTNEVKALTAQISRFTSNYAARTASVSMDNRRYAQAVSQLRNEITGSGVKNTLSLLEQKTFAASKAIIELSDDIVRGKTVAQFGTGIIGKAVLKAPLFLQKGLTWSARALGWVGLVDLALWGTTLAVDYGLNFFLEEEEQGWLSERAGFSFIDEWFITPALNWLFGLIAPTEAEIDAFQSIILLAAGTDTGQALVGTILNWYVDAFTVYPKLMLAFDYEADLPLGSFIPKDPLIILDAMFVAIVLKAMWVLWAIPIKNTFFPSQSL